MTRADMTTALLLIDLQVDFASPDGAMARAGRDLSLVPGALALASALLDGARAAGVPPVFVHLEGHDMCRPGTPGAALVVGPPRLGEMVVPKPRFSAFAGTGLAVTLKKQGIVTLVLAGLTSECCIASTAWHGLEEGFQLVIAMDACAAYEPALHDASLRALSLSGVRLARTADILAEWKK